MLGQIFWLVTWNYCWETQNRITLVDVDNCWTQGDSTPTTQWGYIDYFIIRALRHQAPAGVLHGTGISGSLLNSLFKCVSSLRCFHLMFKRYMFQANLEWWNMFLPREIPRTCPLVRSYSPRLSLVCGYLHYSPKLVSGSKHYLGWASTFGHSLLPALVHAWTISIQLELDHWATGSTNSKAGIFYIPRWHMCSPWEEYTRMMTPQFSAYRLFGVPWFPCGTWDFNKVGLWQPKHPLVLGCFWAFLFEFCREVDSSRHLFRCWSSQNLELSSCPPLERWVDL